MSKNLLKLKTFSLLIILLFGFYIYSYIYSYLSPEFEKQNLQKVQQKTKVEYQKLTKNTTSPTIAIKYKTAIFTPTPAPRILSANTSNLHELFTKYSHYYGVSEKLLKQIAWCESKFNPSSVNGPYAGIFQFTTSAWTKSRKAMGLEENPELRFDPEESIKTAAFKISQDGIGAWPLCSR